jgi:ankyrin repeat protein
MLAIQRGRAAMVDRLLARGARIGLASALMMGDDAAVDRLLRHGLPGQAPNGGSWLIFARTEQAIDRLLALGADPLVADRWGATPIEALSRTGERGRDLVRHLMLRGVAPDPRQLARLGDRDGLARLAEGDPAMLRDGAVLHAAIDGRQADLVAWLLSQGADPNARDLAMPPRQSALHAAAWNGDLAMVRLLVEAGADPSARDAEHDSTPLGWAQTAIKLTANPRCAEVADWLAALAPD